MSTIIHVIPASAGSNKVGHLTALPISVVPKGNDVNETGSAIEGGASFHSSHARGRITAKEAAEGFLTRRLTVYVWKQVADNEYNVN